MSSEGSGLVGFSLRVAPIVAALGLMACESPVNDDQITCLGGEQPGVPTSAFHRPGQPCIVCHGDYQGDKPIMAVAGTIFATPSNPVPVEGVRVRLTDSAGSTKDATTNCIGNWWIDSDAWMPAFPLRAEIVCPSTAPDDPDQPPRRLVMGTRITRDGSCAGCHIGPPAQDSPGWIFCGKTMPQPPYRVKDSCQGLASGELPGLPPGKCK